MTGRGVETLPLVTNAAPATSVLARVELIDLERAPDDDRLPYPGLRAFRQDESDLFFGREQCIDVMLDRLAVSRFLAVLGASGSGKSSLVRTGLLNALALGLHPKASSRWKVAQLAPGTEPVRNLATALLASVAETAPTDIEVNLFVSFLRRGPRSIIEWAAGNLPPKWHLLIIVDQFEELFRYRDYGRREERDAFVALLQEVSLDPHGRVSIVMTMRSEYLGACSMLPGLALRIGEGVYLAARMSRAQCAEAIEGPAAVMGFGIEPELVMRLLNDLAGFAPWERAEVDEQAEQLAREADQLPLMQHTLNRLWRKARERAGAAPVMLRLGDYLELGSIQGVLDAHGAEMTDALQARFGPQIMGTCERVFRALVSGPSLAMAVRRPLRMDVLVQETGDDPEAVAAVVDAFCAPDCNFLRVSEPVDGNARLVDISHESLIRQWRNLSEWFMLELRDGADWTRLHGMASIEDGSILPEGAQLSFFEAWWKKSRPQAGWAKRYGGDFATTERFLMTSIAARQRAHRFRLAGAVLLVLLLLLTVSAAFLQHGKAVREANARKLDRIEHERALKANEVNVAMLEALNHISRLLCADSLVRGAQGEMQIDCVVRLTSRLYPSVSRINPVPESRAGGYLAPAPAAGAARASKGVAHVP